MSVATATGDRLAERHRPATRLEALLGDPRDARNPCGFAAAVERDRESRFPHELSDAVRSAGAHLCYLPRRLGGTLDGYDRALTLVRAAARRDLAVMPATMISISAVTSLLAGGGESDIERAAEIVRGGGTIAFALSEEESGSDLLASSCRVEPAGSELLLSGTKWMVGVASRCDALYVVARSGGRGPGAFSALLLDGAQLGHRNVSASAPVPVDGMRGIDFVCYAFERCPVPPTALVGEPGHGLEAAMKAQQVVRMMSAAGSLAAADTALRVTLDFARSRVLGRSVLVELPRARRELALAFAALVAADAVSLASTRALHVDPRRFSVWSSVVKRVATDLCEESLALCAAVLGARSLIAAGAGGIFQKMRRDNAVVRFIDTSPVANLRMIAMQLPLIARHGPGDRDARDERLRLTFSLAHDLPELRAEALRLHAGGDDDVTDAVGELARDAARELDEPARALVAELADELDRLRARAAAAQRGDDPLDDAERFCFLHAGAACLLLWWHNRDEQLFGEPPGSARWLTAALAYLLAKARRRVPEAHPEVLATALGLHAGDRSFSAVPVELAAPATGREATGGTNGAV